MAIEVNNNDLVVNGLTAINITGLATSTVVASGTNTSRSLQNRFADTVNVKDYGAVGNGIVDDTAAFVSAVTASPASVNIFKGDNSIPYPNVVKIYIPPGTYNLTSLVTTGGRKVIWELSQSAKITNYSYLNGKVLRNGERVTNSSPFGIRDNAVGMSVMSRTEDLEKGAEVTGITNIRDFGWYSDRDSVSFYAENVSNSLVADITNATYTLSAINPSTPLTTDQVKKLVKGMVIETKSSPKWTGLLNSWATNGTSLSTTGWVKYTGVKAITNRGAWTTSTAYIVGDYFTNSGLEYIVEINHTSSNIAADLAANKIDFITGTPGSGGACINPFTKIWGHNANVTLTTAGYASAATGFELGVLNNLATPANATALPKMWGMDVVNLGTYKASVAYTSRGDFFRAYEATGADVSLFSIDAKDRDIVCIDSNAYETFVLDADAGRIELGNTNIAGTRVIDFRNSGTPGNDYDCRIRAVSGTGTGTGQGYMSLLAARVGVGTEAPNEKLTVSGNISATDTLFASNLNINQNREDKDFRLGSTTRDFLIGGDASTSRVAINHPTLAPAGTLDIFATTGVPCLVVNANNLNSDFQIGSSVVDHMLYGAANNSRIGINTSTPTGSLDIVRYGASSVNGPILVVNADNKDADFQFGSQATDFLLFGDASANTIGIGTSAANQRLTVSGNISATGTVTTNSDIEITDFTKGYILPDPSGNRYRITILTGGILSAVAI